LQVYRYPHRFLLEFQIPEPGAWWRHLLAQGENGSAAVAPGPFTTNGQPAAPMLSPEFINEGNYGAIASRFGAIGLPTAPPPTITASVTLKFEDPGPNPDVNKKQPIRFHSDATLTIPDGYRAVHWSAEVLSWHNGSFRNDGATVWVAVGNTVAAQSSSHGASISTDLSHDLDNLTGTVPVALMSDAVFGFGVNVVVTCWRLDSKVREWQQPVYDILVQTHQQQQRAYEEVMRAAEESSGISISGVNPLRNRQIVRDELKKHVAQLLLRGKVGTNALEDNNGGYPRINEDQMRWLAPTVSFFEQAFEWENLSYVLYPYYWADQNDWPALAATEGTDPEFASFLRAGSARVIVPARPGFETAVNFFLCTGWVWAGIQMLALGHPWYLSIDAEIRAQQKGPEDGQAIGEPWEVRLPTELVWLQLEPDLPTNPHVQLV
jgi:hypothetical protein